MKKYVITIQDDACLRNGKDDAMVIGLINKVKEYGTVEDYDRHMDVQNAKWQRELDGVKAEFEKAKAVACKNDAELALVKAYRAGVESEVAVVNAEKEKYKVELNNNRAKLEALKVSITAALEN